MWDWINKNTTVKLQKGGNMCKLGYNGIVWQWQWLEHNRTRWTTETTSINHYNTIKRCNINVFNCSFERMEWREVNSVIRRRGGRWVFLSLVCLSVRHTFERQRLFAVGYGKVCSGVVVQPCSTLSDCCQLATTLNAIVQKTAKMVFFSLTEGLCWRNNPNFCRFLDFGI